MTGRAVTNSTCLIALERIGQLALLPQIFATVLAPPAVQSEFGSPIGWLAVEAVKDLRVVTVLRTQLDDGEAHAIALAMELGDIFIILDDKKPRRVARQMGLKVIVTVGVVLRAERQGAIASTTPMLRALEETEFRIQAPRLGS